MQLGQQVRFAGCVQSGESNALKMPTSWWTTAEQTLTLQRLSEAKKDQKEAQRQQMQITDSFSRAGSSHKSYDGKKD